RRSAGRLTFTQPIIELTVPARMRQSGGPRRMRTKEPSRKIPRDIHEHARDVARSFAGTEGFELSRRQRKKIEMRFAHLKRILKLGRLRLRGPQGAQDEFVLAAIAQNLRRFASLVARPSLAQALRIA
ncbi:transposase, partial [Bradyrhizobium sp. 145]|uniref:transposase n=1 Tax=Bradyrhizobium sp. 145 TaxID=2782621 RepID=UPI001FF99D59